METKFIALSTDDVSKVIAALDDFSLSLFMSNRKEESSRVEALSNFLFRKSLSVI